MEHFPPSNPIFLIRLLVLLVLQDVQGTILYLLRFCDGYIDADVLRDYVENYPEYFMTNLEEKQYLIQRYTPQLIQELALLPTSLTRIQRLLNHPVVEGTVMTLFSLLVLLLLFHRTQIQPEILFDSQWPQSKDHVAADSTTEAVAKDEKEMRRAQSILHMKAFSAAPASSSIPVGRTGSDAIIDRQHMPQRSAVQPKASVTEQAQINSNGKTEAAANESEASYEREQSQREAAKNARLRQFPPPSNPLAQKPSRMRTLLKAASVTMGMKRVNSVSSVSSDTSTTNKSTEPVALSNGKTTPVSSQEPMSSTTATVATTNGTGNVPSTGGTSAEVSPLIPTSNSAASVSPPDTAAPKPSSAKPKLMLRFDSQDASVLRVVEEPPAKVVSETNGKEATESKLAVSTEFSPLKPNNGGQAAFMTPPRPTVTTSASTSRLPPLGTPIQTPYSTVSSLTPDSHFLSMVQRHRSLDSGRDGFGGDGSVMDDDGGEEDDDDRADSVSMISESTGYAMSDGGGIASGQGGSYVDDANAPPEVVMERSVTRPAILIGWRVMIPGYGTGLILSIKKKRFATTKFVIQLENDQIVALKLQRGKDKGNVPFHLLRKVR